MDSLPDQTMITIASSNHRVEGEISDPPQKFELLLHIVADICVRCGGKAVYEEESFPIVELALALEQWLRNSHPVSFEFFSMESDEGPLLRFEYTNGAFSFFSEHQIGECQVKSDWESLQRAVRDFCSDVRKASTKLLGLDAVAAVMT